MTAPGRRESLLPWLGVLGAPGAWALQHLVGFWLSEAMCADAHVPGRDVHLDGWTTAVTAAAAVAAAAGGLAAVATWRATRDVDHGSPPPRGRVSFLAVIGMTITPLFVALILMNGFGAVAQIGCRQS